jgi:prepilin-type N-terminal cleavage/methylation domain-containing protein
MTQARSQTTSKRGFTLVEMVLTISIVGIIVLVASFVVVESVKIYAGTATALDAAYQSRLALERMTREIHDVKDSSSITTFTASALTFTNSSNVSIAYALSSGNLTRNGDLLAKGATALSFTYWKKDGTSATLGSNVYLIEIDLTVQSGNAPYRVRTAVFPRNLGP